ncbi:oligosaccharide flippase family protein [Roseivivax sp.]
MPRNSSIATLAKNLAAYGASEAAAKASRLFVVIAVARVMDVREVGIAAAALAAADILKALTENGVNQRIIAAREENLEATCATAHRIFWTWCLGLFAAQAAVAGLLYAAGGSAAVALLILVLAGEYLFMPAGLVQAALAMREGRMRRTAAIAGGQVVIANLLSVALALVWPVALALILPRLLTAPFWLIAMRRLRPWQRNRAAGFAPIKPFLAFGWAVLGVEIVKAARLQADKLIVGALLGAETLGLYFMAFNAGLSLANSFSVAFATVLFPHLCAQADRAGALRESLLLSLGLIVPAVLAQSLLAPWYVPLLLGPDWAELSHLVSILCLAAIPTLIWTAAAGWLRSSNRAEIEFGATLVLTLAVIANTLVMAPHGLTAIALGYLGVSTLTMVGASLPALAFAFLSSPQRA